MFEIGQDIEIHYPVTTHVRYIERQPALRKRLIRIHSIRDLVAKPLTPAEFLQRPYVRRSRWLVLATEYGKTHPQQFYIGCSLEFAAPSQLRLGLYEPGTAKPKSLILRPFEPTVHDRDALRRWLQRYSVEDHGGLQLGIYSDDLRLHKAS